MKIEQRHREAAADLMSKIANDDIPTWRLISEISAGKADHTSFPQAFARFEASLTKRDDELADRLEYWAGTCLGRATTIEPLNNLGLDLSTAAARLRGGEREEDRKAEIIAAYMQGAMDVHENWQEDRDPDFTEAAHDYYASLRAESQS